MSKTFGKVLKEARIQQGLRALDIVKATGINQSTYSKYENDEAKNVSIENVGRLCAFLHIDANQLFNRNADEIVIISEGVEYKGKLIEQLNTCIESIRNADCEGLKECLEKVKIKDEVNTLEIEYQQKNFSFGKNDPLRLITLCCIINQYINDVLKKLEEEMTKKFDKKLIRLYVQCENILNDILSK